MQKQQTYKLNQWVQRGTNICIQRKPTSQTKPKTETKTSNQTKIPTQQTKK